MYVKPPKALVTALYAALGAGVAYLCLRYLLPWLSPFIIAFAAAALLEPLVVTLVGRCKFPRQLASGLCTVTLIGGAVWLVAVLASRVASELGALISRTPELIEQLTVLLERLDVGVAGYIAKSPGELAKYLLAFIDSLPEQIASLAGSLSGKALSMLTSFAGKTPAALLFTATCGIGVYFISSEYPGIAAFIKRQIPKRWRGEASGLRAVFSGSLVKWFKAQLIIMLITFGGLIVAFTVLRVDYAVLLALVTAVVDALPVLGSGTALIPWAVVALIFGDISRAVGLVITYGAMALIRNIVQAKLIGDSFGLNPVITLIAVYIGFCAMGVWGMILFPIFAVMIKQMNDRGLFHIWN